MESENHGFLATVGETPEAESEGIVRYTCSIASDCMKAPDEQHVPWLDHFRDATCKVVRYPNTSAIPASIRSVFDVCMNKSGLSVALPNAITRSRKAHVERFHFIVKGSEWQKKKDGLHGQSVSTVNSQNSPLLPFHGGILPAPHPLHEGHLRILQEVDLQMPYSMQADQTAPPATSLSRAYLGSMPYYLLPGFAGLVVAGVLLPLLLLVFFFRNHKCCRKVCSCLCWIRPCFKLSKRHFNRLEHYDSSGSSTTASESQCRGGRRMLVPRRSCMGLRYLTLFLTTLIALACLGVGIYVIIDLHAQLSQLMCSTAQAASTIMNGQAFSSGVESSASESRRIPASYFSSFVASSPFLAAPSLAVADDLTQADQSLLPAAPGGVRTLSAVFLPPEELSEQHRGSDTRRSIRGRKPCTEPSSPPPPPSPGNPCLPCLAFVSYAGTDMGRTAARHLQEAHAEAADDAAEPKRTGFIGVVPALDYFESLLAALDKKRPDFLPNELRLGGTLATRIKKKVVNVKKDLRTLQEVGEHSGMRHARCTRPDACSLKFLGCADMLFNPLNSGTTVKRVQRSSEAPSQQPSYHLSLVAGGSASLLSSWETLGNLLPEGLTMITSASEQLAGEIEDVLARTGTFVSAEQLQQAKVAVYETLAQAHSALEPLPRISEPLFWALLVAFSLLASLLLLASMYLCCMCCCKKQDLVDKKAMSCGCSLLMIVIAAAALVASGVFLASTALLTDGCIYTGEFVKGEEDIDDLLRYFWPEQGGVEVSAGDASKASSLMAQVLAACFLPSKERNLVTVLGMNELVSAGKEMEKMSSWAMQSEARAARLLSLELQDAAAELQLLEDTYWLFLLDPVALEEEALEDRLFTYREILCSGLQDKQRTVKLSYLGVGSPVAVAAGPSGAASSQASSSSSSWKAPVLLLQTEEWEPKAELAAVLHALDPDPGAAGRLSASLQQALGELQGSRDSRKAEAAFAKRLVDGALSEVVQLAKGKSEAQKMQILQSIVRLTGRASSEAQASKRRGGDDVSRDQQRERRRRQTRQRKKLRELLLDQCMMQGSPGGASSSGEGGLVVYGMEDVEELVAPFVLASLHGGDTRESESRESGLTIDAFFDADSPLVAKLAAEKGSAEEQRRFTNAVWWAAVKESLREEAARSFACPEEVASPEAPIQWTSCNFQEVQEATHKLLRKLHAQLEALWAELRPFFESRSRVFRLAGVDYATAANNLDCHIVRSEAQPVAELMCEKVRPAGANMAFVLLLLSGAALLLLPVFYCLWRAGVENTWIQRDARKGVMAAHRRPSSPREDFNSPTIISAPTPSSGNTAAAAAVAAAAAATAAAASGLTQQPSIQQRPQVDREIQFS
ncbi:uncharacterized protein LOC34621828 [Cyclospora cayetanensis]|uniref:Uncharacterized protein LOC34621828 n=1 Tax=Cyclospora cayetanensis TaxID=88456 RepID=A0A6P6RQ75_9EIME|nr:uncharacterized protein LOC34621828 [Cyclospora cayetanensis]